MRPNLRDDIEVQPDPAVPGGAVLIDPAARRIVRLAAPEAAALKDLGRAPLLAAELRALGFRWFEPGDADGIAEFLASPDEGLLDHNEQLARKHFSFESMRDQLRLLLEDAGWLP